MINHDTLLDLGVAYFQNWLCSVGSAYVPPHSRMIQAMLYIGSQMGLNLQGASEDVVCCDQNQRV